MQDLKAIPVLTGFRHRAIARGTHVKFPRKCQAGTIGPRPVNSSLSRSGSTKTCRARSEASVGQRKPLEIQPCHMDMRLVIEGLRVDLAPLEGVDREVGQGDGVQADTSSSWWASAAVKVQP